MKKIYFFSLFYFLFLQTQAQEVIFRHYEISATPREIPLNCALEDPYGMIWVGSEKGLYSFDGSSFHLERYNDNSVHEVTALFCDSTHVWIGSSDGILAVRSVRIWKKDIAIHKSYGAKITGICSDEKGTISIATYGKGVFIMNNENHYHLDMSNGLPANDIYSMKQSHDGTLWLGSDEGLISCEKMWSKPVITSYTSLNGLPDQIINEVEIDARNNVWVGTYSKGVSIFNTKSKTFSTPAFSKDWSYGKVTSLCISENRRILIGTDGSGLLSVSFDDLSSLSVLNEAQGYKSSRISHIMLDQEGNFWVTHSNGFDLIPGLLEWMQDYKGSAQAVLVDHSHRLWIANDSGLFRWKSTNPDKFYSEKINLRSGKRPPYINALYEDHKKNVWIATMDEGVFIMPDEELPALNFTESNGLANKSVLSINGDDTNVWIATFGGISRCTLNDYKRERPVFQNYQGENGIRSNYIYQLLIDSKQRVWFASDGDGLIKLENGKITSILSIDSFSTKTIYSVTEDKKGNLWFSTLASGIFRFDGKNYKHFGTREDIADLNISAIVADANSDILIFEQEGIEVLESRTDQVRRYSGRPFFNDVNPGINSYCKDSFQNIWIATSKGILKYFPLSKSFSDEARLELTQVLVDLQPIDFAVQHHFAYNQNHFTFGYLGFWNINPSQVRYRYQLKGFDSTWIETKDMRVNYPNMPPGNYSFKVQATIHHNFDDAITRIFVFTINPPYWYTWWFIICVILIIAFIILVLVRWREKEIKTAAELKRKNLEFQFENLKTQINPHFLFNSFNTLLEIIDVNQNLAMEFVENLSDFYRNTLKYKETDLLTLSEEIELTHSFIFLLEQRYAKNLQVMIRIDHSSMDALIPPLTLQILIENAVKHNVVSRANPLFVEIFIDESKQLCVRNNLQRRNEPIVSTHIGLKNVNARMEFLHGKPVEIIETENHFEIKLKLFKP